MAKEKREKRDWLALLAIPVLLVFVAIFFKPLEDLWSNRVLAWINKTTEVSTTIEAYLSTESETLGATTTFATDYPSGTTTEVSTTLVKLTTIEKPTEPPRSAIVTIPLSDTGAEARVRVYLDDTLIKEEFILVGNSYSVELSGNKPAALEVHIDGRKVYAATVNFDKNPPTLTDERLF